jgi:transcriptional regulator with XRE-family HTH domain
MPKHKTLRQYFEGVDETQQAFADRVGITPAHLSRIVNAQGAPSLDVAVRIASAARIPVESLLPPNKTKNRAA